MNGGHINGTWLVVQSTDPAIRKGTTARFGIVPDGLQIVVQGGAAYEIPWAAARLTTASSGQAVIDSGHGTVWADPEAGADPAQLEAAFADNRAATAKGKRHEEFPAGEGRLLVLYRGGDDGSEVDPAHLMATMATDAADRAAEGWCLVSMVGLPLRHAGQKVFGVEGSGYTTKAAVGWLYEREAAPVPGPVAEGPNAARATPPPR